MARGQPLSQLTDDVEPDGALDSVRLSLLGLPFELKAYAQILGTLGVGGYRDDQLARSGAIDYGTDHYSCFQFDYDWRRDNVENARLLHRFIQEHRAEVQANFAEDYGGDPADYDVKFDIVAHSMGGLLSRYMLRYGDADLPAPPDDGSAAPLPEITWAGAEHVDRVVLVGTPSAGAINALTELVNGAKYSPFHNGYSPAVLGTMPAIYQLLPRDRHRRVTFANRIQVASRTGIAGDPIHIEPIHMAMPNQGIFALRKPPIAYGQPISPPLFGPPSLFDLGTWHMHRWGLADNDQDRQLRKLLPEVEDPAERRRIALDHLQKCLARAEQFHAALDAPAPLPEHLTLILYAGDGQPTPDVASVNATGRITDITQTPGDGTVTRESALMDERVGQDWSPRLQTPIDWTDVNFLFTDHLGLTADPVFADNVLHLLLESPRRAMAPDPD